MCVCVCVCSQNSVSTSGATGDTRTEHPPNTCQNVVNTASHLVRELWFIIIIIFHKIQWRKQGKGFAN